MAEVASPRKPTYEVILSGYPGTSNRGVLGWSSIVAVRAVPLTVLFDTGSAADRKGLLAGLARVGLEPVRVDVVVISHLHFDHASNAELFPNSKVIVHETEIDYALCHGATDLGLSAWLTSGLMSMAPQIVAEELELSPGVRIINTPGHTAGHISLMIESEEGVVVLAGDALKDRTEAADKHSPSAFDPDAGAASIRRILDLADVVIPGHDTALRVGPRGVVEAIDKEVEPPFIANVWADRGREPARPASGAGGNQEGRA